MHDITQRLGMPGILRLIAECNEPHAVGLTLPILEMDTDEWASWIIQHGEGFQRTTPTSQCIGGLLGALSRQHTQAILGEVLEFGTCNNWDAEQQARFLALAPALKTTWDLATAKGADVDAAYWRCVSLWGWVRDWGGDAPYALQHLLEVHRPKTALHCCRFDLERTDVHLLLEMLQRFVQGEEVDGPRLESWDIEKVLERLEQSGEVEKTVLLQLEFMLFPALRHANEAGVETLFEAITTDPGIFAELISLVFKPEHDERDGAISDDQRNAATNAWEILRACKRQPGTRLDGSIDRDAFIRFIDAARELCRQADRLHRGEYVLGEILSYAPSDEDGTWPFAPAREVLDRPDLEQMRRGFHIGTINKRGVTTRSPWDGGDQERDLAAYYRSNSEKVQHDQPRVAELLESLAHSYERDAVREDNEADLRKEGF